MRKIQFSTGFGVLVLVLSFASAVAQSDDTDKQVDLNPDYSPGEKMSIARAFELDGCSFGDETLGLGGHWQVGAGSFRRIWYDFVPLLATRHTSPMTIACGNGLY